jgi:hypothetical protein
LHQQQFLVTDPAVLNLFPVVPPIDLLDDFSQPQIRRVMNDDLQSSRSLRVMFTVERLLPKNIKLSVSYFHGRTDRTQRTVNINAPLGGTFIPGLPTAASGRSAPKPETSSNTNRPAARSETTSTST